MYHDQLDLKYIMYNIDIERTYTTRDIAGVMNLVSGYYPDVKYYKPHTGECLDIAGMQLDVLYALEDRYVPNENGELITDYPTIVNGEATTAYDVGGTYRENMYESNGKSDFNDTSTVLRVHLNNELDCILYADMNLAENVLLSIYPDSALETDIMMVPHHGHDAHPELCDLSNAKIFLYTQHKDAIFGPDGDLSTKDGAGLYRPALRNNYLEMQQYIETEGSKTYWSGNETVCILAGDAETESANIPADMTRDTAAPGGFTVYTAPAYSFVYEDWTVDDDETGSGGSWEGDFHEVETGTAMVKMNQVTNGTLTAETRYVIVHDATDNILLHDAVNNVTSSLTAGTIAEAVNGEVEAYYRYVTDEDGTNHPDQADVTSLYFGHHYRDQALWIQRNLYEEEGKTTNAMASVDPKYGGSSAYRYSMYTKGLTPEDDSYWYTTAADTKATRALQPNYLNGGVTLADPSSQNIYTEFFEDGTCVLYYYKADGTDIRFLFCDSNGNWMQKRYNDTAAKNKTAIAKDLDALKLRVYRYNPLSDIKTVGYQGRQEYTVLTSVSQEDIASRIMDGITVMDTSRRNTPIPGNGTTPKVGEYWLRFPDNYTAGTVGDYLVTINYRNDDGTDTVVGTVVVHVVKEIAVSGATADGEGLVSKKAGLGATVQYFDEETQENRDCILTVTFNTPSGYVTETLPIVVGMLTDSSGNPVDTGVEGTYTGLTLTYRDIKISDNFTLTVSGGSEELNYPEYPEKGSVREKKTGTTTQEQFSETGVANIQLSSTGIPMQNGVDLIVVMDLSGSMDNALDTNTAAPRLRRQPCVRHGAVSEGYDPGASGLRHRCSRRHVRLRRSGQP